MWIWLLIALTVVAAGFSVYGSLDTRRDLKTGAPSYASVVDYTGIGSPDKLEQLLGSPDENQRFAIPPGDAAKLPRRAWVGLLDSIVGDCIAGALSVAGGIVARHSPVWGWGTRADGGGVSHIRVLLGRLGCPPSPATTRIEWDFEFAVHHALSFSRNEPVPRASQRLA